MFKILTVIGARPQIIKSAALSRAVKNRKSEVEEILVHTGQHYDENMSAIFFDELAIPQPNYNLNVGSGSHGQQTAKMIAGIEEILVKEKPNCIVLYGDTNSTVAGALAAAKIHVPVVHIEAGLRSFNKSMPEEINRIMCDHVSTLLFSPTSQGFQNLLNEGFKQNNEKPFSANNPKIYHCGDVMFDNSLFFADLAASKSTFLEQYNLKPKQFLLATIHRDNNTDQPERLKNIVDAFETIFKKYGFKIVLPIHPRTTSKLKQYFGDNFNELLSQKGIIITPPASFLEIIDLEKNAIMVLSDSGGVQKEAYFFKTPCVVLRPETEWTEIVDNGNNIVADADTQKIINAFEHLFQKKDFTYPAFFGDGKAAEFILNEILIHLQ